MKRSWIQRKPEHKGFKKPVFGEKVERKPGKALRPRSESRKQILEAQWNTELEITLAPITWCERCGRSGCRLDRAHRLKRAKIPVKNDLVAWKKEYFMVAKLCRGCHNFVEYGTKDEPGTHERMFELVTNIIEQRDYSCLPDLYLILF